MESTFNEFHLSGNMTQKSRCNIIDHHTKTVFVVEYKGVRLVFRQLFSNYKAMFVISLIDALDAKK